jgi:hypothetical protein
MVKKMLMIWGNYLGDGTLFLLMQGEIKWVDYWLEVKGFIFFLISSPLNEDQEIFYILGI